MAMRHKWKFVARFRANAYGWRGSAPTIKRLKEAINGDAASFAGQWYE